MLKLYFCIGWYLGHLPDGPWLPVPLNLKGNLNHCIIAVTLSQNNGITDLLKGKKQTVTINHLRCFLAYDDQQIVL